MSFVILRVAIVCLLSMPMLGLVRAASADEPIATGQASLPAGSPAEQAAMGMMSSYFYFWSTSETDVESMSQFYADTVSFYGSVLTRDKLMDEKRRFARRWPSRSFTIRPDTLSAHCTGEGCSVTGIVEWEASSVERGAHSNGISTFTLMTTAPVSGNSAGLIVSENGSVLSVHRDTRVSAESAPALSADAASAPDVVGSDGLPAGQQVLATMPAYAEGRAARTRYETWVAAIPEGPYKAGVDFWASHRSVKPVPSCNGTNAANDWEQGCKAAQAILDPSDVRRKLDKTYRLGWNSY